MGASLSTLVGWTVVIGCVYVIGFGFPGKKKTRDGVRGGSQRQRLEDRQHSQSRKEAKEKAKRQRGEAYSKDAEENKSAQLKARAPKTTVPSQPVVDYSSDDSVDNREFARQLASVKQGTNLNAPKKSAEKRQRSVKQSRAQIMDDKIDEAKVSAPSSTAGVDADDDDSSTPSPEVKAVDAGDVSDMLEPKAPGPSVLRLTDTEKAKPKKEKKKAKEPEKTETKKQRQNRQKAEAAKALREETERQRKIDMEAQRRRARIAEGRPAQDGSAFTAAQAKQSAWTGNGVNGSPDSSATNGEFVPVQPLDTFDTSSYTDVSVTKSTGQAKNTTADSWMASLPSEEEQMEMLRDEEAWSTVTTKKSSKKKKEAAAAAAAAATAAESPADSEPTVVQPQAVPAKAQATSNGATLAAGKPTKAFSQQSAFAALSTNDDEEVENEWDV